MSLQWDRPLHEMTKFYNVSMHFFFMKIKLNYCRFKIVSIGLFITKQYFHCNTYQFDRYCESKNAFDTIIFWIRCMVLYRLCTFFISILSLFYFFSLPLRNESPFQSIRQLLMIRFNCNMTKDFDANLPPTLTYQGHQDSYRFCWWSYVRIIFSY